MPIRYTDAEPGMAPAAQQSAGTMFAALYGTLDPHAWLGPDVQDDAYSLFYKRSLDMGWHDDRSAGGDAGQGARAAGLWAMNDAGWEHPRAAPEAGLVSWFQVEVSAVASDRPLPVQPLLRCAEDTTRRQGVLDLTAVQLLLPVQGLPATRPPSIPVPSLRTTSWHSTGGDPTRRASARVSINSGSDPLIASIATDLMGQVGDLTVDVFTCETHKTAEPQDVFTAPFADWHWNGPAQHGVTMDGAFATWSCESIGWFAEVIADCTAQLGYQSPLLFTAVRTTG